MALPEDIAAVLNVLSDAARWVRALGIDQWPDRFPREVVEPTIAAGECFVAVADNAVVATLTVLDSDPRFWGERADALFVHRLAVARAHRGLGAQLLKWVDARACRVGKQFVCLDCMAKNARLRDYYSALGFREVGDLKGATWEATLFERPCASSDAVR